MPEKAAEKQKMILDYLREEVYHWGLGAQRCADIHEMMEEGRRYPVL